MDTVSNNNETDMLRPHSFAEASRIGYEAMHRNNTCVITAFSSLRKGQRVPYPNPQHPPPSTPPTRIVTLQFQILKNYN